MNAKNIPFGMPLIDENERDAVANVLNGPILVHGPQAVAFEAAFAEFSGAPHAVSVSSCTAGMHLVWFNQNIGAGDEVIVPAQTHVATAHAVELTGACPIFVDCELDTGNIDIDAIEAAITPRTKGIVVVHFLGMPVDMTRVMEIADRHDLFVLEDCALSVGAKLDGIHTGLLGHAGVFSFYPVKHMTTAEGGIIITKDRELADRLRLTKAFGVDRTHGERKIPGLYDVTELGFNYRMSEIHAAIGIEQIAKLPKFIEDRVRNDDLLREALTKIDGISVLNTTSRGRFTATHYCLSIILDEVLAPLRPKIMEKMSALGIGTSIYYPHPVPRFTYYQNKYGYDSSAYTNAEVISDRSIALPVAPHTNAEDMTRIAESLTITLKGLRS